jgi:hypothetical protein
VLDRHKVSKFHNIRSRRATSLSPALREEKFMVKREAAELLRSSLKRLSKNAIPYGDTGFIIAFLATANEDAQS